MVDGNGSFVGTLDRANIFQSVKQAGPDARVADAMTASPVLTVGGAAREACGDLTDIQETSVLKRNHPEA